jgi:DNA-binding beta-propeller fold protein YncE
MSLSPMFWKRKQRGRVIVPAVAGLFSAILAGCGAGYRPVITPTNPTGPASQPGSYATVVSNTGSGSPGVVNVIDYSGDTVVAQATVGWGPLAFTVDETGSNGYTYNSDGTISDFPTSTALQQKYVYNTTVAPKSAPFGFLAPAGALWATDLNNDDTDVFAGTSPAVFVRAIPVGPTPVMSIGPGLGPARIYTITQGDGVGATTCNTAPTSATAGEAYGIEVSNDTISSTIPLGKCPVYAVQSPDGRRVFVLNRGDDTVTVINSQFDALDECTPFLNQAGQLVTCHPTLPLSTAAVSSTGIQPVNPTAANLPAIAGPVYGEFNSATNQLVIADFAGGTISIIDVTLDEYGNDGPTFGTTYTVKVGNTATPNPASVTVLNDGSRAYTANQNDDATGNGTGNGTVSIVDLSAHTLEKTLQVGGHPRTVVSTQNSQYGKVYVASPDSPYLTIVRTDQDIVDTTVLVQGLVLDVRVSSQNASGGNSNITSRRPGYGEPCNLSAQQLGSSPTYEECQSQSAPAASSGVARR